MIQVHINIRDASETCSWNLNIKKIDDIVLHGFSWLLTFLDLILVSQACAIYISLIVRVQINNAGTNTWKSRVDYTAEDIQAIMETNFVSAYHLSQLAHPLLKTSGMGNVVLISSVAGVVALYSGTVYAASKGNSIYDNNFLFVMWLVSCDCCV